jgi:DNA polymerase-3 subunit delta
VKLDEFRRVLSDLTFRPVLLVVGAEPYLKQLIVDALKKRGAEAHGEGFVCHTYYAHSSKAREVVAECRSGEFFVTSKLVLLRGVDGYRKEELGVLAEYVRAPDAASSLVMTAEGIDGRTAFAKAIGKAAGGRIDLKPMYENEMPAWIDALAARRTKRVSRAAREALVELCGTNLSALAAEIDKLDLYVGERERIEGEDAAVVVGSSRTETYYRLRDAILEGRTGDALEIWGTLIDDGESVYALFGRLRMTLRELVTAREMVDGGAKPAEIGRALGVPAWRLQGMTAVLAKTSVGRLVRSLVLLFDADVDLRQSRLTERQVAERLLVSLSAA